MSEEKPLHVQVAEALGWTEVVHFTPTTSSVIAPVWAGAPPKGYEHWKHGITEADFLHMSHGGPERRTIPRYDTDWSATGPLLERFGIASAPSPHGYRYRIGVTEGPEIAYWPAGGYDSTHECWDWEALGATRLIAACNLLVELAAAGKLEPTLGAADAMRLANEHEERAYRATPPEGGWKGMPE